MTHVTLDGKNMLRKEDVHPYLKSKLNLNGYYGNNLDALWDALCSHNEPLQINLVHHEQILEHLKNYGISLIKVFEDAVRENCHIRFEMGKH